MLSHVRNAIRRIRYDEADFSVPLVPYVAETIRRSPLMESPYPHIVVDDVLPDDVYRDVLANWPARGVLPPETGDIGRFIGCLIWKKAVLKDYGPFWRDFSNTVGQTLVASVLEKLEPYNSLRFGARQKYEAMLSLFESGQNFRQHGAHTHHNHSPQWASTFLLFLDDGERTDRGEVLSTPSKDDNWLDIVSARTQNLHLKPAKRIPFKRNTLLAWLDGPMSFHGTDDIPGDKENRRLILRCHISCDERAASARLGATPKQFHLACQAHGAGDSSYLEAILRTPNNMVSALRRFDTH